MWSRSIFLAARYQGLGFLRQHGNFVRHRQRRCPTRASLARGSSFSGLDAGWRREADVGMGAPLGCRSETSAGLLVSWDGLCLALASRPRAPPSRTRAFGGCPVRCLFCLSASWRAGGPRLSAGLSDHPCPTIPLHRRGWRRVPAAVLGAAAWLSAAVRAGSGSRSGPSHLPPWTVLFSFTPLGGAAQPCLVC